MGKPDRSAQLREYHRRFADSLIGQIKAGTAPWQKPWKPGERVLPENATTGKSYTGGNSLYLAVKAQQRGFADNRWATYRQIAHAGGHVRKGERGEQVLFLDRTTLVPQKDDKGEPVRDDKGRQVYDRIERQRPLCRRYTVFNVEQTGGLELSSRPAPKADWQAHQAAEAVIEHSRVEVIHAGDQPYYTPKEDRIVLPSRAQFPSADSYYATAFHELGHATGHESRMDRATLREGVSKGYGSTEYAREELRAEISAMMTGERIGVGHTPQHGVAYVAGWVKALENDPREIHRAAADASRMSAYLIEPARDHIDRIDARATEHLTRTRRERIPTLPVRVPTPAQQPTRDAGISR